LMYSLRLSAWNPRIRNGYWTRGGVHAPVARPTLRVGLPALTDPDRRGRGVVDGHAPLAVDEPLPQPVQMRYRDRAQAPELPPAETLSSRRSTARVAGPERRFASQTATHVRLGPTPVLTSRENLGPPFMLILRETTLDLDNGQMTTYNGVTISENDLPWMGM